MIAKITAAEFAAAYAARSGVTVEELRALGRDVRPCRCGWEHCEGWQMTNAAEWDADHPGTQSPFTEGPEEVD